MIITEVKVRQVYQNESGRLKAVVSITVDNALAVHDLKVIQGDERLFVAMPSRKDEHGVFRDIAHPIVSYCRQQIESAVISAYIEYLKENPSA